MDVRLVVQSAGRAAREIPITLDEFIIGRDLGCHFRVDHDRVDHRHCRIRRAKDRVMVEDLNSIHGTTVNDHAIKKVEARDGDRLRVGPATFTFVIGADGKPAGGDGALSGVFAPKAPRISTTNPLDSAFESAASGSARALLARMTGGLQERDRPIERLRLVEIRGVAVVRLLEAMLVEEDDVRELADALDAVIAGGKVRVAVNFEEVENLAGQAIGVLARAHDRCRDGGGLLKLCGVGRQVGHALALMGMDQFFAIAADEPSALDGDWPGAPRAAAPAAEPAPETGTRVRLVVMAGKAQGKAIEVARSKFLIGRDASCHLRPNSPTISRLHTTIERRGGRVFVRDLGAKNSTILNDRALQGEEAEVADGDRLQVGPLLFTFALGDGEVAPSTPPGESSTNWLLPEKDDGQAPTSLMSTTMIQASPAPSPGATKTPAAGPTLPTAPLQALEFEATEDALLIRVLAAELDDEPTVGPFRYELCELFERPLPRRVVIDLGRVRYLSSRGVGVILAHFQRLGRAGGALRLCDVHRNVVSVLEQMRVPMLIEVFPSAEDALREPWETPATSPPTG